MKIRSGMELTDLVVLLQQQLVLALQLVIPPLQLLAAT